MDTVLPSHPTSPGVSWDGNIGPQFSEPAVMQAAIYIANYVAPPPPPPPSGGIPYDPTFVPARTVAGLKIR